MRVLALAALAIAAPSMAAAQARTQPPPRPRPQQARKPATPTPQIGIRPYAMLGSTTLAAQETFEAVAGSYGHPAFGGGAQVTRLWKGAFADVGVSRLRLEGERVFISNRQVFRLDIPLEVTMRAVDAAGGWRFSFAAGRVSPYAGAGFTYLSYEETSDFAEGGENVSEGGSGPFVLGGVDVQVWRRVHAGLDLRWRRVRGILGEAGTSAEFDEDDAGGVTAALRISFALR